MATRVFSHAALLSLFLTTVTLAQMGPSDVVVAPVELRKVQLTSPLVASVEPVTRSTLAAAAISSAVSPFIRSATRNAAASASSNEPAVNCWKAVRINSSGKSHRSSRIGNASMAQGERTGVTMIETQGDGARNDDHA